MEHYELVQEMGSVERMSTQERLKHARKRRAQQMKRWGQYERQLEKESTKKKKNQDKQQPPKKVRRNNRGHVIFAPNITLLEAAARNDLNEVKKLLESGVNPNVTNEDGLTALHQCCIDDSEDMLKLLLDYNADVNACDSEIWTPLHAAATCGHMMLCKHLIDRGAELLAVNADGNMPYDICEDEITLDHIETEMAKRGITQEQIDMTRLATEHKMLDDVRQFTEEGGDLETVDGNGATLLHIAAANGYIEVAEFLLDNHVSVDRQDNESWQPLHAAAFWAQQDILEMLVENGADLDSKTKNGETPFDLCEEPDLKQKILDMKDEIETKRSIRQQRLGSQRRHRVISRNASMRRSSLRGDKSQLFKKEHKEEALHFGLNLMHDEDSLTEADEDHDMLPSTDLDAVKIVVTRDDEGPPSPPLPAPQQDSHDGDTHIHSSPLPFSEGVTTITITSQDQDNPTARSQSHVTDSKKSRPPPPSMGDGPGYSQAATINSSGSRPANISSQAGPKQVVSGIQNASAARGGNLGPQVAPKPGRLTSSGPRPTDPGPPQSGPKSVTPGTQNASISRGTNPSIQTGPKAMPPGTQNASISRGTNPGSQTGPRSGTTPNSSISRGTNPQVMPRHSGGGPGMSNERRQSGSTLSDLKRQRSNSRENLLDLAVQNMFLESVQGGRQSGGSQGSVGVRDKSKNGYNNNAVHYSSEEQLRRFVAPTSSPVVGGEEGKQKCCVIL